MKDVSNYISPKKLMVMEMSNLAYLLLALFMASKHYAGASLVFFVFAVSTIHHYFAYNQSWLKFDMFVATAVSVLLICLYVPLANYTSTTFLCALFIAIIAFWFYFNSGIEYGSTKYELYHGLWHVLTAASMYLILISEGRRID